MNTKQILEQYNENGFYVFKDVIDIKLIDDVNRHVDWLENKFDVESPEHLHHPLMRDDAFWLNLISDKRLLDIVRLVLGEDIVCFTSHYICKPPKVGIPVYWHQDAAYWNIKPMNALSLWLAIDNSTTQNGCLHFIPGSHKGPVHPLVSDSSNKNMLSSTLSQNYIDESKSVPVELSPGDVSIHHPNIIHGSFENKSNFRRRGLDIGYTTTEARFGKTNLYMSPFLLTDSDIENPSIYSPWPKYNQENSMYFEDNKKWDDRADYFNNKYGFSHPDDLESVMDITNRMMRRLKNVSTSKECP